MREEIKNALKTLHALCLVIQGYIEVDTESGDIGSESVGKDIKNKKGLAMDLIDEIIRKNKKDLNDSQINWLVAAKGAINKRLRNPFEEFLRNFDTIFEL